MGQSKANRRRTWMWVALASLILVVALVIAADVMLHRAEPILRARVIRALSSRFQSRVELKALNVAVWPGLGVSGEGLSIYPPDEVVAAGATQPLISINHFSFGSGLLGFLIPPMHVRQVQVSGLEINIPPRKMRRQTPGKPGKKRVNLDILVDEIVCDNSRLIIGNAKPDKDPKVFELRHIKLHDVGRTDPWQYEATLINAIPRGEINAKGTFGPWQTESPGDSSVTGHYTFTHADLNTIKGIGGILSSVGDFQGQLDRIVVDGTTDTPDFSLDTAHQPVPLHTQFHAVVDGITGDTYLEAIHAKLQNSSFVTSGKVINIKGTGHVIDLDVDVGQGHVQDFLDLAVNTRPPVMTGIISTKTKLHIRPGKDRVVNRLSFQGGFTLAGIRFTNPQVQDKVDMASLRAQGEPEKARPGAEDVNSRMTGIYALNGGVIRFTNLAYVMPGASVNLAGTYSLDGQLFDFRGNIQTDVALSRMVENRWLSLALRVASPFFSRKGGGAQIPISISGTKSAPKFGLDVFGSHSKNDESIAKGNR